MSDFDHISDAQADAFVASSESHQLPEGLTPVNNAPQTTEKKAKKKKAVVPFLCLGYNHGEYFYLPAGTKQIVTLEAKEHSRNSLLRLAGIGYWRTSYASDSEEGDGVNWANAVSSLYTQCHELGIFTSRKVRGRGAWIDGEEILFHAGDRILVTGGDAIDISDFESKYTYERGEAMEMADALPASDEEGQKLVELCNALSWRNGLMGRLFAGWCALAPICGVLEWRPHIWMNGASGSGKTWVYVNILQPLVGPTAMQIMGSSTEAGCRQTLRSDARPVIFDEAESENKAGQVRLQNFLHLVRVASSESGAKIIKGTAGGSSIETTIRACFAFSSIGVSAIDRADISRITKLELVRKGGPAGRNAFAEVKKLLAGSILTPGYSDRIRARCLTQAFQIRANAAVFAQALAVHLGDQRMGDQLGALVAGYWSLKTSAVATAEEAKKWIEEQDWSGFSLDAVDNDESRAVNVLLDHQLTLVTTLTERRTVGELIEMALDHTAEWHNEACGLLVRNGMRVNSENRTLTVSNSHASIAAAFSDTPWASKWSDQLSRMSGAKACSGAKFAGSTHRAVILPIATLFNEGATAVQTAIPF